MRVLFDQQVFSENLEGNITMQRKAFFDIVYNDSVELVFSKHYLSHLEASMLDNDFFKALIVELNDKGRIFMQATKGLGTIEEEFVELSCNHSEPFTFDIVNEKSTVALSNLKNVYKIDGLNSTYKEKIIFELLTKNICSVCYQDFKKDEEVKSFFADVFKIPLFIKEVTVFDREQAFEHLISLKGQLIFYYSMLPAGRGNEYIRKEAKKDLRRDLGGKLKLYYTRDRRIIHERKIIVDSLIITIDNSTNNLSITEPTWEITIHYNSSKAKAWKEKCKLFYEVI